VVALQFEWDPPKAERSLALQGVTFEDMRGAGKNADMLDEYDFAGGVCGKYAERYAEGTNVVVIDSDVAEYFPDHDAVNDALRDLVEIIRRREKGE
jgi:hypothetical protein